ncbi:MAG: phage tail protein [Saprospiraceae bacterium]
MPNENFYPPPGFYFEVRLSDKVTKDEIDACFQAVGGLSVEFDTETYKEGGELRFEHVLPNRSKYPVLTLRRGLVPKSGLGNWCKDAFQNMIFQPSDLTVTLKNEKGEALKVWSVAHAWPKKWSVSDFNAEANAIVVETLELQYRYFDTITP